MQANFGLTLAQAANAATREVRPVGETDEQRQDRRAGIAQAQFQARMGRALNPNAGGAQLGGDGQPGVGRGANPGQYRRKPGSGPLNHTTDPSQ